MSIALALPRLPPLARLQMALFVTPAVSEKAVREEADSPVRWQEWVLYLLAAVETTAQQTISTVTDIKAALLDTKHRIRAGFKSYSQDLVNNLFMHLHTKIEFVERDLKVSRLTATKYLDALAMAGFVQKVKVGRSNYHINLALNAILTRELGYGELTP